MGLAGGLARAQAQEAAPSRTTPQKTIKRLKRIERGGQPLSFSACVPLEESSEGPKPVAQSSDGRRAACVRMRKGANDLAKALAKDPHVGWSLQVPAKENGLDIEGIAVDGDRVFLGLRGPVLRGMAVMIELSVENKGNGRLKLRKAFGDEQRYRLHFLDLGGMGIRDMILDGARLLMLIGPTMDLDGPVAVVALDDPFRDLHDVTFADEIRHVLRVPHGAGTDRAEGLALTDEGRF
ncbi:MAG: DUF3616 domain-containing protein [Rhodovibrio sp.]|nr:DUF3616 domain-containing protein [Rhodovibrio sp.]